MPNEYRTHTCGDLNKTQVGETVTLSGWIYRRRDHGGVAFVDLRDAYGITQIVFDPQSAGAELIDKVTHTSLETVIRVEGTVVARDEAQINPKMKTGEIEVDVASMDVLSADIEQIPYNISDESIPEDMRLKYRFMDLRTERMSRNIGLRSDVIASMRRRMWDLNFKEHQTPLITSSSPEGARDFLVPSRVHPGKFYALPQAPQQFKQLLMVSGFDKYFQIAPCFRDEDARADRSPTEFYQLDMEMSFVTQEDTFKAFEDVFPPLMEEFSDYTGVKYEVDQGPLRRITYADSMLKYASDKPDLRIAIEIMDVSEEWAASDFGVFKGIVEKQGHVRAIPAPGAAAQPRSWFEKLGSWAQKQLGMPAAPGYITWAEGGFKGPLLKFISEESVKSMFERAGLKQGDSLFFVAGKTPDLYKQLSPLRVRIGEDLGLKEENAFRICWIVDFPIYERDEETGKLDFEHNPFSMPQGGMEALETQDPLTIVGYQYDAVCNGFEILSGAIRNHKPEIMYKAFELAGHDKSVVDAQFGGMIKAFKLGAPPHGGWAIGVERTIMLLADTANIREITAFPMTQRAEDLLMEAPSEASPEQLMELHIKHVNLPQAEETAVA